MSLTLTIYGILCYLFQFHLIYILLPSNRKEIWQSFNKKNYIAKLKDQKDIYLQHLFKDSTILNK